jgi:hypothetical protein
MRTYVNTVRNRLRMAATAAGVVSNLPDAPADMAVSVAVYEARRCGVTISSVLDDRLGVESDR